MYRKFEIDEEMNMGKINERMSEAIN